MIEMKAPVRKDLVSYLAMEYPFEVIADPEGGYVIRFPDLPGCMTQTDDLRDVGPLAEEIRTLWIETEYEAGEEIPLPSRQEEYSGKFNVRLPRTLHRTLVESAEREGVSLNQYVATLLARGDTQRQMDQRLAELDAKLANLASTSRTHEHAGVAE